MTSKNDLLRQIQQFNFAMIELALYLDNQPDCQNALAMYARVRMEYLRVRKEYEDRYGPLSYDGIDTAGNGWSWLDGPWPWEGEESFMWTYEKRLEYPVNIKNPNPAMAKFIISQVGGPDGELAASQRYLSQRYSMPYNEAKATLTDVGTEELAHL